MKANFARDQTLDAIIAYSIRAAMVAISVIVSLNGNVGEEIDVIGKESTRLLQLFRPEVISYFEDIADAGGFLVHTAIAACEQPDDPPLQFPEVPSLEKYICILQ